MLHERSTLSERGPQPVMSCGNGHGGTDTGTTLLSREAALKCERVAPAWARAGRGAQPAAGAGGEARARGAVAPALPMIHTNFHRWQIPNLVPSAPAPARPAARTLPTQGARPPSPQPGANQRNGETSNGEGETAPARLDKLSELGPVDCRSERDHLRHRREGRGVLVERVEVAGLVELREGRGGEERGRRAGAVRCNGLVGHGPKVMVFPLPRAAARGVERSAGAGAAAGLAARAEGCAAEALRAGEAFCQRLSP